MLTYAKNEDNTTSIIHEGEIVGFIEVIDEDFQVSVHDKNFKVKRRNKAKIKEYVGILHDMAMEFKAYEDYSYALAEKRGFTIKG